MASEERTHYEVLGIKPSAKHTEIDIAYQRIMGKRRGEHAPPDPRGDARIREAYEVLSDVESREYYDAELRQAALRAPLPVGRLVMAALAAAALGAAAWWFLKPAPSVKLEAEAPTKIAQAAAPSVGRIERIQMSGAAEPGVAFSIEEGVMVTSCLRLPAGSQLVVTMLGRRVPATVRSTDAASGMCQLSAPNTGTWPLSLTGVAPQPGERVFSAGVDAKGEVVLREGSVKRIVTDPAGKVIETTLQLGRDAAGAPLFDTQGRVVAVALVGDDGRAKQVIPPAAWLGPMTARSASAKAAEEAAKREAQEQAEEAAKPQPVDDLGRPMGKVHIDAQRKKELEKAFRPPPNVPGDL